MEADDASALPAEFVPKIRKILSFLENMGPEDELRAAPNWKAHQLTGSRKGVWSLSVSRNWRMTFKVENTSIEIIDLNYEDYH